MIVAVSAAAPVAVPVTTPPDTEATPDALLLHVPNGLASLKLVERPWHTVSVPVIGEGNGFTVTIAVAIQPVGMV